MKKRIPYVGEGRDGCLRSAEIDRSEADGMPPGADRDARLASAADWERQAETERWEPTREELVELTSWMATHDHSATDVAYAVEKPWKHKDLWDLCQMEKAL